MASIAFRKLSILQQYLYSLLLITAVSSLSFAFSGYTGYHVPALLLLVTVSIIAMFCDIVPVLVAAVTSALIWNFYFIPPLFTFHIGKSEDILLFLMYFVIALLNAVLTIKIRQMEKQAQKREEQENFIKTYNVLLDSLANELNQPISKILEASIEIRKNSQSQGLEDNIQFNDEIVLSSLRLDRQVANIITMSKLESGTLDLNKEWCEIDGIVHEIVKKIREARVTQRFEIQIPESLPSFYLDRLLIEQALYNLLHNAVIYSPDLSPITLSVTFIIDQLVVTVEDQGVGYPEDQLDNIFERSNRLAVTKSGGLGLGLFIVKGIVEAHNGSVLMKNRNEGGAMFSLSMPVKTSYVRNWVKE
jgi:two-component system, OmpR family, sensor histidine kinase KdpD